jgi:hypothetical protein
MNNSAQVAEIQRQIAEHQAATVRLTEQLQRASQLATNNISEHGQTNGIKLSARSHTTMGYTMAAPMMSPSSSDDRATKRQRRAISQQISPQMNRSASDRSQSGMPFRPIGPVLPLAAPTRSIPNVQHGHGVTQSPATIMPDVGMSPDDFLAGFGDVQPYMPSIGANPSGIDMTNTQPGSQCPSMVSGWSAGEGLTPMTRQNSFFGESFADVDMNRIASASQSSRGFMNGDVPPTPGSNGKRTFGEQDIIGIGANYTTDMSLSFSSSLRSAGFCLPSPNESVDANAMERSESNISTASMKSNASIKRRNKEALDRVIRTGQATPLAPKPKAPSDKSATVSVPVKKEAKVPVPKKNTYQRRKPVKVFCEQCTEHPEGFRGDHELRRHTNAKHEGRVKKFICRDPATVGIHTNLKAVKPLSNCKQCTNKKQYGAYYNAAAHLRRQHFNPRVARGKGASEEKRGGKGGGDWPRMIDLKAWFEACIVEDNSDNTELDHDDADFDSSAPELDFEMCVLPSTDTPADPYELCSLDDGVLMPIMAPVSTGSTSFTLSQFPETLSAHGMLSAFTEEAAQVYGSPFSSANTITPSTFQDMTQVPYGDSTWEMSV